MDVVLQMPAFREGDWSDTMDEWAAQEPPEFVESYVRQAWVTPATEPADDDETWTVAKHHPDFTAYRAPKYKLIARNTAHDHAFASGADVVVVADADAPPLHEDTLSNLLHAVREEDVVSSVANPVWDLNSDGGGGKWMRRLNYGNFTETLKEAVGGMHGQCHTLTREGWEGAGPFDEDLDQTEMGEVWPEEEFRFPRRLRNFGRVVYRWDAPVMNDMRRSYCKMVPECMQEDGVCDRFESDETFAPDLHER